MASYLGVLLSSVWENEISRDINILVAGLLEILSPWWMRNSPYELIELSPPKPDEFCVLWIAADKRVGSTVGFTSICGR